jgi:Cu/Ag efflux protein CusF
LGKPAINWPVLYEQKEEGSMRKVVAVMVAALFLLSLFGLAFAAAKHVTGEVSAIDTAAKTLTVKEKKGEMVLSYSDTTPVTEGKEKKSIADLKVGEKVEVTYVEKEGKNVAESIAIVKVEEKKPAK